MKIIFAQGNPGNEFALTRHNVGFYLIDALAKKYGAIFTTKTKFHAEMAETAVGGQKILLVKPATYYNETGKSARAIIDFYKLSPITDFIVLHDDLALPFGTIRTRPSGSDAGNNGIKSLNAHLGQQYARIRVGIYNPLRDQIPDADFVLARFTKDEVDQLPALLEQTEGFIGKFIDDNFPSTKISL